MMEAHMGDKRYAKEKEESGGDPAARAFTGANQD